MIFVAIEIKVTENKGRGMFALEYIPAYQIIETAPVIVMDAEERKLLDKTLLHDYIFEWTPNEKPQCIMALGYVPIYNHSYASNAEYTMDYDAQTISIQSVRPIAVGEEILINYNGDWNNETPLWFEVKD
ncbi:MAG: SET domain-containing protein [Phycisphaerales bacterium]|nr:SET domain-containing protein [Phycisphaerales bacterium]